MVLGHRLKDTALREQLEERIGQQDIYWIVPEPASEATFPADTSWQIGLGNGVTKLDGTALEFAYDLFAKVREVEGNPAY